MKGIVFTEFLDMVEEKFGYEVVDEMLQAVPLESKGVYTSIGTYKHKEMVGLITFLHKKTGVPQSELLKTFGRYLFGTFKSNYGHFFSQADNAFDFLESIDNHIHVEVKKLYPDAQLPRFENKRVSDKKLEMIYSSERKMGDFAEGLIAKTLKHYKESATITKELLKEDGSLVKFTICRN